MTTTTANLANVPHPAGAIHVDDWSDIQFGIDHVRRYFRGSERVFERGNDRDITVDIDGTQRPDGDVTRQVMVVEGKYVRLDCVRLQLSGDHARQLGRALIVRGHEKVPTGGQVEVHRVHAQLMLVVVFMDGEDRPVMTWLPRPVVISYRLTSNPIGRQRCRQPAL
jgi:hypothetical protein